MIRKVTIMARPKRQFTDEPKCDCGKTAAEHDEELSIHHYWYFHKESLKGCHYCEAEDSFRKGYF